MRQTIIASAVPALALRNHCAFDPTNENRLVICKARRFADCKLQKLIKASPQSIAAIAAVPKRGEAFVMTAKKREPRSIPLDTAVRIAVFRAIYLLGV
jgi:hypothetical protein